MSTDEVYSHLLTHEMRLEQQITVLDFSNASANSIVKGSVNNEGPN